MQNNRKRGKNGFGRTDGPICRFREQNSTSCLNLRVRAWEENGDGDEKYTCIQIFQSQAMKRNLGYDERHKRRKLKLQILIFLLFGRVENSVLFFFFHLSHFFFGFCLR